MNKPTHIRYYCVNCIREHSDTMDRAEAISAANTLLEAGCPYVLLTDVVNHALLTADGLEAACRNPVTIGESLKAHYVGEATDQLIKRVFPGKSA